MNSSEGRRNHGGKHPDINEGGKFAWKHGCTVDEISQITGMSVAMVRLTLVRALSKLRASPAMRQIYEN